jgi:trk system potassium uptake protein TrkH
MFDLRHIYPHCDEALQKAAFHVASIISSSGFTTTGYNLWPGLSKTVIILLMFIGACAGSTGGGLKVSRIIIMFKSARLAIRKMIHPKSVKQMRISGEIVSADIVRGVRVYIGIYSPIFALSLILISVDNLDFTTNFTAVSAALNNVAPGLGDVGPAGNFGKYSMFSKLVLGADMLIGRLEIFPVLLLISPATWRKAR